MAWRRVALELICAYRFQEPVSGEPPSYCKYGPGHPEIHCFMGRKKHPFEEENDEDEPTPCPYAAYTYATSTALLTDEKGEQIASSCFWTNENISAEEWTEREKAWQEEMKNRLADSEPPVKTDSPPFPPIYLKRKTNSIGWISLPQQRRRFDLA